MSEEESKQRSIMAVFYLILLQMTGYFDSAGGDVTSGQRPSPSLASIYQMKGKENDASLSEVDGGFTQMFTFKKT